MSRSSMESKGTELNRMEPTTTEPVALPPKRVVRIGPMRLDRRVAIAAGLALLLVAVVLARGVGRKDAKAAEIPFEPVARRNISLTVEATGTVEPIDLVEVKSKASGQIIRMPVQVGSIVRKGDLLAQIDTRDVQNQYDQSLAALRAAQAKAQISLAQKRRSDNLFAQAVITAPEHEAATLDYANSQAQMVKARTDLDLARQRREDARVEAPIAGTVLEQTVANGQVISSATSSASGGTTLLKMADLGQIRIRALVAESDVGNVHPGQSATVTVDAFPNRTFLGTVEKIEPQAIVQQSVTMFPVLIAISNEESLLLPGMNGEVSMVIEQREDVPAVPVDAVRSVREMPVVAELLGLKPDKVKDELQRQVDARAKERQARFAGADSAGGGRLAAGSGRRGAGGGAPGDSARGGRGAWRRGDGGAEGTSGGGRSGRGGRGSGQWAGRRAGGGAQGGVASNGGGSAGGAQGGANMGGATGGGAGRRAQAVFVKTATGIEPRLVRLGLSDFDYAQVVDGLKEGEMVALLSVAEAQAQRQQTRSQIRQRMGSGVPGQPGAGGGGRGAGGGGSGGGRSPGGGGGGGGR